LTETDRLLVLGPPINGGTAVDPVVNPKAMVELVYPAAWPCAVMIRLMLKVFSRWLILKVTPGWSSWMDKDLMGMPFRLRFISECLLSRWLTDKVPPVVLLGVPWGRTGVHGALWEAIGDAVGWAFKSIVRN